jgi:hypothetical protein
VPALLLSCCFVFWRFLELPAGWLDLCVVYDDGQATSTDISTNMLCTNHVLSTATEAVPLQQSSPTAANQLLQCRHVAGGT